MNVLLLKRLMILAIITFLLPFASISVAEEKAVSYDSKQLVRDVATLYREHKKALVADQMAEKEATKISMIAKKSGTKKKLTVAKKQSIKHPKNKFVSSASFKKKKQMTVEATAYTSHVGQTDSTPNIAAWNDRLEPGMKVIAVSRDMLNKYGMKHRTKVRIKGLDGEYLVLDKMNKRWKKKIDIYMGKDLKKAFKWGRRKVEIEWQ